MRFEVIDGQKWQIISQSNGLSRGQANHNPPDQSRAGRRGHAGQLVKVETGLIHGALDNSAHQGEMRTRCDFWHNAPIGRMLINLRINDRREDFAARTMANNAGRGLIATRLDP